MGKNNQKQQDKFLPLLPPEVADEVRAYTGFVKNLDTQSITNHVMRVANAKQDDALPYRTGLKRKRFPLESLPIELQIKVACGVNHDDVKQLKQVSKSICDAATIAENSYFAYTTPRSIKYEPHSPNAPNRPSKARKKLNYTSVPLFDFALVM